MANWKPWLVGLSAALFCLASAGTAADPQDDATKKELKALEGVWGMVSTSDSSGDVTKDYGHIKYTFTKGKYRGDDNGKQGALGSGTVVLDVDHKPKMMALIPDVDGDKGKEEYSYELKGDELKLYFHESRDDYPADFKDSGVIIQVFKRLK
ncbi:MAG TPA: TIGR03067 domain-containing protein [Gemmataceae bacterium]|nr:TIGR03067 domain-containing protein [Gemmataceae bacterium]